MTGCVPTGGSAPTPVARIYRAVIEIIAVIVKLASWGSTLAPTAEPAEALLFISEVSPGAGSSRTGIGIRASIAVITGIEVVNVFAELSDEIAATGGAGVAIIAIGIRIAVKLDCVPLPIGPDSGADHYAGSMGKCPFDQTISRIAEQKIGVVW